MSDRKPMEQRSAEEIEDLKLEALKRVYYGHHCGDTMMAYAAVLESAVKRKGVSVEVPHAPTTILWVRQLESTLWPNGEKPPKVAIKCGVSKKVIRVHVKCDYWKRFASRCGACVNDCKMQIDPSVEDDLCDLCCYSSKPPEAQ